MNKNIDKAGGKPVQKGPPRTSQARDQGIMRGEVDIARRVILGVLALVIIAVFYFVTQGIIKSYSKPEERNRTIPSFSVRGEYASAKDIQLSLAVQGEARATTEIDLVPEVGGKIVYISPNFIDGGIFKKGETLVRIDDSDYKVSVIRAESGVAQAEQALAQEIAEGEIARRDYEELGQGSASPLALRQPQRQRAEAALQAAKAELQSAKLQLTRTSVRSPFNGRVKTRTAGLGQFVAPGSRMGRIFSSDVFEVRLALTDSDLAKVDLPIAFVAKDRASAPEVLLRDTVAGQPQVWSGRIMRTDSTFDTQTRTMAAIAEIADPYGKGLSDNGIAISPGRFIQADLQGKVFENVVVIPRDGLRPDNLVYVVDETGQAEIRYPDVIHTTPEEAILRSGVSRGEIVILSPMEKSRINMKLKVVDANDSSNVLVEPEPRRGGGDSDGDSSKETTTQ